MSSIYIKEFYPNANRKTVLKVIDDMVSGNSLKHFKSRWIENIVATERIDWRKRYDSSNYMNTVLSEYIDYVQELRKTTDNNNIDTFDDKKKEVLNVFFNKNSWDSFVKNCCYYRKKCGDVYIYWFIDKDEETNIEYPKLIFLDSKDMEIKINENEEITHYVYEKVIRYDEPLENGEFTSKTKTVKWVLYKGGVSIYENGILKENIPNRKEFKDFIPIIHLQFLVDVDSKYSIIPAEDLIDSALTLDKLETDISLINHLMGYPQLTIIDGVLDKSSSGFGPNGIIYIDSVVDNKIQDEQYKRRFQAKVQQLEINNELKSMYLQLDNKVETIYSKANLISPKTYLALAKSNSSKVLEAARKDLEQELKNFYIEFADKFKKIFKVLYALNNIEIKGEITVRIPEHIIDPTVYDKYMLKAQKLNIGEMTLTENLKDIGFTDEEILKHKQELNNEFYENGKDITTTFSKIEGVPKVDTVKSLDNNFKKGADMRRTVQVEMEKQKSTPMPIEKPVAVEESISSQEELKEEIKVPKQKIVEKKTKTTVKEKNEKK